MADDNNIGVRVEGDTDPFSRDFDEAIDKAEGRSRDLGRVFDGVAQHISELGGEVPLKTDEAQEALRRAEEAARRAAAQARAFGDEARAGGAGAGEAAGKAAVSIAKLEAEVAKLKAAGRSVEALEAELKSLQSQAAAIPPSMGAAEAAVAQFGVRAEKGGKGAALALGAATAATDRLEAEIDQLAAKGVNVDGFRRKLDAMRVSIEANTIKAGKMRAAVADAGDALRVATARGGELTGQMGSLDGILRLLGAGSLAETAERALALQGAFLITISTAKQVYEILDKLTKQAGDAWAESLIRQDEAMRLASGETVQYAQNLRNILARQGYDVASDSLSGLIAKEGEFQARLRQRRDAVEEIVKQATGDRKALEDSVAATLAAVAQVQKSGEANAQQYASLGRSVTELIAKHKEMGQVVPAELERQRSVLARLATTAADYARAHDAILEAVGVQTPEQVDKAITSLLAYAREVELAGDVTAEQAAKIRGGIGSIRTQMEELPEGARQGLEGMLGSLEELESRYAGTADVAARAFGSTTPEAISRSVEALRGLIEAWGGVAGTTQEQAARIAAEAQKIRESIATLPAAERDAAAAQAEILEGITVTYGRVAGSRQKFAVDVLEAERKAAEEEARLIKEREERLDSLTGKIAGTFRQLQQAASAPVDGGGEEIAGLTAEIQELEKANREAGLSIDELNKLGDLKGQLAGAQQAAASWGGEAKKTTVGAKEVDAAMSGLFDTLAQDGGAAFRELNEVQQGAIRSLITNLQQTAQTTGATSDDISTAFGRIGQVLEEAGGSIGNLGNDLARSSEETLDLGREFDRLNPSLDAAGNAMGKIGEEAKTTSERQEEAAQKTEEFAERAEKAAESVVKSAGKMNEQFSTMSDTMGRCVELLEAIDRLASGISIDEAA